MKKNLIAIIVFLLLSIIVIIIFIINRPSEVYQLISDDSNFELKNVLIYRSFNYRNQGITSGTLLIKNEEVIKDIKYYEIQYCFYDNCHYVKQGGLNTQNIEIKNNKITLSGITTRFKGFFYDKPEKSYNEYIEKLNNIYLKIITKNGDDEKEYKISLKNSHKKIF